MMERKHERDMMGQLQAHFHNGPGLLGPIKCVFFFKKKWASCWTRSPLAHWYSPSSPLTWRFPIWWQESRVISFFTIREEHDKGWPKHDPLGYSAGPDRPSSPIFSPAIFSPWSGLRWKTWSWGNGRALGSFNRDFRVRALLVRLCGSQYANELTKGWTN